MVATVRPLVSSAMWEQSNGLSEAVPKISVIYMHFYSSSFLFCARERHKRAPSVVVVLWGGNGSILSSTSQGAPALSIALFLSVSTLQLETQARMHHNSASLTYRKW